MNTSRFLLPVALVLAALVPPSARAQSASAAAGGASISTTATVGTGPGSGTLVPPPNGDDTDGDGLSNYDELYRTGSDPKVKNTDFPQDINGDNDPTDLTDGWPRTAWITAPRIPDVRYAVVRLQSIGLPSSASAIELDDDANVLAIDGSTGDNYLFLKSSAGTVETVPLLPWSPTSGSSVPRYFGLIPPSFLSRSGGHVASWLITDQAAPSGTGAGTWITGDTDATPLGPISTGGFPPYYWTTAINGSGKVVGIQAPDYNAYPIEVGQSGEDDFGGVDYSSGTWLGSSHIHFTWNEHSSTVTGVAYLPTVLNEGNLVGVIKTDETGGIFRMGIMEAANFTDLGPTGGFDYYSSDGYLPGNRMVAITSGSPVIALALRYEGTTPANTAWWAHQQGGTWVKEDIKVWDPGTQAPVPLTDSGYLGINDRLEIIQTKIDPSTYGLTVSNLIRNGVIHPLADYFPSGWTAPLATDINNSGIILANATPPSASIAQPVLLVPAALQVDANHDGQIDANDPTPTATKPFRFWSNDDDDGGSIATCDIPGSSTPDGQKTKVQGVRDLIDYFPVLLDIKQLLTILPPGTNNITYKLKQADSGVRFVYTDLKREDAFKYLNDNTTGDSLKEADAHWATSTGYELDATWLGQVKDSDKGVILVEGRNATDKPLVLSVEKSGTVIAEVSLNIKISSVEDMFRHLNLRDGAGAAAGIMGDQRDSGRSTYTGKADGSGPDNLPDASANQPWFIFVVGSNVGGQSARGWEAETFKRLYWSRGTDGKFAKTRFLGVSWFGDPYADGSEGVYDYHLAVRNAFATAPALAAAVNNLPGTGSKTIGGHSLACGLISAALSDHGMNVTHATLIDAAIAREVFDGRAGSGSQLNDEENGMTPAIWRNYDPRLQSPSWHERFAALPGDNRQTLTWRNRFIGAVPTIHSFYSPTEDALGSYDGEVPSTSLGAAAVVVMNGAAFTAYVWVYQEKAKGNRQDYYLPFLGSFHAGSTYAGWGMNIKDPVLSGDPTHWKWVNSPDYIGRMIKTSAEIGSVSDSILRRHPVFEPGWGVVRNQEQQEIPVSNVSPVSNAPSWIYNLYGATSGSSLVGGATSANRAQLLAEAIPAQSWAVGSHQLNTSTLPLSKQHNMPAEYAGTGWPRPTINGVREWRHSDLREVAYLYQSRFWDALVSVSQQP